MSIRDHRAGRTKKPIRKYAREAGPQRDRQERRDSKRGAVRRELAQL
jgi:hypothetical protein